MAEKKKLTQRQESNRKVAKEVDEVAEKAGASKLARGAAVAQSVNSASSFKDFMQQDKTRREASVGRYDPSIGERVYSRGTKAYEESDIKHRKSVKYGTRLPR